MGLHVGVSVGLKDDGNSVGNAVLLVGFLLTVGFAVGYKVGFAVGYMVGFAVVGDNVDTASVTKNDPRNISE